MPISQNENIGNFDLFSNITEGMGVGCGQGLPTVLPKLSLGAASSRLGLGKMGC